MGYDLGQLFNDSRGHTDNVRCVIQLADDRLVSGSEDETIRIWNIMSLCQQKWIRRRLLVLLSETSKILSEPTESEVIGHSLRLLDPARRHDLELFIRCSLNINDNTINNNDNKAFKTALRVLSVSDIVVQIVEYL